MNIGVHAASSQSGRAYLSDLKKQGHDVYGYCRESSHGKEFVETIYKQGGIYLNRPSENINKELSSTFIPLSSSEVGHSFEKLFDKSDVIILAEPSIFFTESVIAMKVAGICNKRIPLILSPSRTFTVPKIWEVLGEGYPVICFSTCAYSCKAPEPGVSFIKRRKRSWIASVEGDVEGEIIDELKRAFPQCVWTNVPAATSLGNIGSVFHPGAYLLNYEDIKLKEKNKEIFSFYMEGIAAKPEVGEVLEKIDNIRLNIAKNVGVKTFIPGCPEDELEWRELMKELRTHEAMAKDDIEALREIRSHYLSKIANCVVGAQFWLDYTYGVARIENEPLHLAIQRTPTYQKNSVPQVRYIDEDMPTGLLPLYEMAKRFEIDTSVCEELIEKYCSIKGISREDLPSWSEYSTEYIIKYLQGKI